MPETEELMILAAEASDLVQIATMLIALLGTVFTGIMSYLVAKLNAKQSAAAVAVNEVKNTLKESTATHGSKLDNLADEVDKVKKATNGMVEKLEEASFARGVKSEVDKHGEQT